MTATLSTEEMDINISTYNGYFTLIHSNLILHDENWPPLADFGNVNIVFKPTSHLALCF